MRLALAAELDEQLVDPLGLGHVDHVVGLQHDDVWMHEARNPRA